MNRKLIAIVPAAGVGERSGAALPKQYQHIHGVPMLRWAVRALLADTRIHQVRVAVAAGDDRVHHTLRGLPRTVWRPCGGPSRAHTVIAALDDARTEGVLQDTDWVLVHDAARPGLPADALASLISSCLDANTGGLLAMPVPDTVKRSVATPSVVTVDTSVPRNNLWLAQTPQMFPAGLLMRALHAALAHNAAITDEASAIEQAGHSPLLVRGSMRNFKVTWPEDFDLMAKWLDDA